MKVPPSFAAVLHPPVPAWSGRGRVHPFQVAPFWRDWLFDQGSLTVRLSQLDARRFRVRVCTQGVGTATSLERRALGISGRAPVWYREVQLLLDDTPVVFARTAAPLSTLKSRAMPLRQLGNRSLGAYLFSRPDLQRSAVRALRCAPNTLGLQWCRHSVFRLFGKPLMVSEAFSSELARSAGETQV